MTPAILSTAGLSAVAAVLLLSWGQFAATLVLARRRRHRPQMTRDRLVALVNLPGLKSGAS